MDEKRADALSEILRSLRLKAGIYVEEDFCGTWAVDTSGHRKVPFHLIESGSGWLHMDELEEPRLLSAGDFVVFPHDTRHSIASSPSPPPASIINQPVDTTADGPITSMFCGYFEFDDKAAWPLLDELPGVIVLDLKDNSRLAGTRALIQLIINELESAGPGMDAAVNELAYVLFIHVLRCQITKGLQRGLLGALFDAKIGRALNVIHADPMHDWTVDRLANAAGMSRSLFAERFKELVNKTPMRYVTEWRMHKASDLLKTTDLSIDAIAERSGYASEIAFRKAFKSIVGEPPGKIRRAAR
ncbi:MAG: AraC family transcriptional regulator [Gammaproteobacteria bacterium]|nr:AraC family transcriptional regulator [Gammaproteobacteria bacterium]